MHQFAPHRRFERSFTSPDLSLSLNGYFPEEGDSSISDDFSLRNSLDSFTSADMNLAASSREASRSGSTFSSFNSSLPRAPDKYRSLLRSYQKLEADNLVLRGQLNVLQDAYSRLLATVGPRDAPIDVNPVTNTLGLSGAPVKQETQLPALSASPEAERKEFPSIKYWSRHEWSASEDLQVASIGAPGKARAAQGENVTMKFVEDEDGKVIDGYRASSIRKFARSLWAGLSKAGRAPKSWGKVDAQTSSQFQIEMCRKFPELRLCEGNWKVDLIATMNYPSWFSNQGKEKEETRKRASVGSLPDPKRLKPALSTTPQAPTPADYTTAMASPAPGANTTEYDLPATTPAPQAQTPADYPTAMAGPAPGANTTEYDLPATTPAPQAQTPADYPTAMAGPAPGANTTEYDLPATTTPTTMEIRPVPKLKRKEPNVHSSRVKNPLSAVASPAAGAKVTEYDPPATTTPTTMEIRPVPKLKRKVPSSRVKNPLSAVASPAAGANDDRSTEYDPPATTTMEISPVLQANTTAPRAEAPHIAGVVPMEDVTFPLADHPAVPPLFVEPSVIPSLATNASIGAMADHSTTSLIGGAPLSSVDPSVIPSLITDESMMIDHSAAPPIDDAHINDDLSAQLPGTLSMAVTISTAMSTMGSEGPVSVHNLNSLNTSAVSISSLLLPEPSSNPHAVKLNPVASTPQMLMDISAAPTASPSIAVIAEKGPTGKKAGIMRPNSHSKTARNLCALAWKELNPQGLTTEFKQYFDGLSPNDLKYWKDREAAAKMSMTSTGITEANIA